jgi:excisionase family DNA binding protein
MKPNHAEVKHQHQKLTPPEVARLFRVSVGKVMTWIRNGELRAVNIALRPDGRPRYRIDRTDIAAFELRRQVVPPPPRTRYYRRSRDQNVTEYF